jgi:hypothetical protein
MIQPTHSPEERFSNMQPIAYGPWLILIVLLLLFNLFSPLNFVLNQLSYSGSFERVLFDKSTFLDWLLHILISLLTPVVLIGFWRRKPGTVMLAIICLSLSLLVDLTASMATIGSNAVLRMEQESAYYSLLTRCLCACQRLCTGAI